MSPIPIPEKLRSCRPGETAVSPIPDRGGPIPEKAGSLSRINSRRHRGPFRSWSAPATSAPYGYAAAGIRAFRAGPWPSKPRTWPPHLLRHSGAGPRGCGPCLSRVSRAPRTRPRDPPVPPWCHDPPPRTCRSRPRTCPRPPHSPAATSLECRRASCHALVTAAGRHVPT